MENIEIRFIEQDNCYYYAGWLVKQGDKYADALSHGDMLALVADLTMPSNPKQRPEYRLMQTKKQRLKTGKLFISTKK
jgi:hypothetical protein